MRDICCLEGRVVFGVEAVGYEPEGVLALVFYLDSDGLDTFVGKVGPEEVLTLLRGQDIDGYRNVTIRPCDGMGHVTGFIKRFRLECGTARSGNQDKDGEQKTNRPILRFGVRKNTHSIQPFYH